MGNCLKFWSLYALRDRFKVGSSRSASSISFRVRFRRRPLGLTHSALPLAHVPHTGWILSHFAFFALHRRQARKRGWDWCTSAGHDEPLTDCGERPSVGAAGVSIRLNMTILLP